MADYMKKIINILENIHDDIDFEAEDTIMDDRLLDSLDILTLVAELNYTFDVAIPIDMITNENFNSVKAICILVESLK